MFSSYTVIEFLQLENWKLFRDKLPSNDVLLRLVVQLFEFHFLCFSYAREDFDQAFVRQRYIQSFYDSNNDTRKHRCESAKLILFCNNFVNGLDLFFWRKFHFCSRLISIPIRRYHLNSSFLSVWTRGDSTMLRILGMCNK